MNVTRKNFKDLLPTVLDDIEKCEFLACDGEFTGISNSSFKTMSFDTVAERYEKLKKGNMDYLMPQVGLCFFIPDADGASYVAKPYNFFVLPRQFNKLNISPQFTCQTSCIEFLAGHGFDFNKVFIDGISYLRPESESKIRDKMMEKRERAEEKQGNTPQSKPALNINKEDKAFIKSLNDQVEKYMADESKTVPLNLAPSSAWRRRLTFETLKNGKFADKVHLASEGTGNSRYVSVTKVAAEEKAELLKQEANKQELELQDAVGLTHVIKAISNSKKVVVGHNMLLDLMYIISQFLAELPETYEEFKVMSTEFFPKLIDTKVISSTHLFREEIPHNSLDELAKALESKIFEQVKITVPVNEGFPSFHLPDENTKFHEAAYDAFVTGKCFAIMSSHIGKKADPPVRNLMANTRLLTPFVNKLYVNRIQDIPYLNLSGPEVTPDRDHVYHVLFPVAWTRTDICQVFSPYGVAVTFIDDQSAMVTLQQRADNPKVQQMFKTQASACVVQTYHEWHRRKSSTNQIQDQSEATSTAQSRRKRKISGSTSSDPSHNANLSAAKVANVKAASQRKSDHGEAVNRDEYSNLSGGKKTGQKGMKVEDTSKLFKEDDDW